MKNTSKEESIFCDALELPADQRASFIRGACAGDKKLLAAVEQLLQISDTEDEFLATPAIGLVSNKLDEHPGDQIECFELVKKIGEGGFGVVWLAKQSEPIKRDVALKIVKLGMDSKNIIRRFDDERQTLAMMNHPNIATVLDAGVTPCGRPFFAMELVEGASLDNFFTDHHLSLDQQLKVFIAVCRAVHYAHQKGVVHRDLKPSNILVTSIGEEVIPKVIDFGIATAIQDDQEREAISCETSMVGTPQYMSPEQWRNEIDIDTRSDIYSLGVILYRMLAGTVPNHDHQTGMQTFIPPSEQRKFNQKANDAEKTPALKSAPKIAKDLDWITRKAMAQHRAARYQSASELATDLERFLSCQAVIANPGGRWYQLKKFVQRNKLGVGSAFAILVLMFIAIVASTWGYMRADQQRQIAEQKKTEAERLKEIAEAEATKLRIIANVFRKMLPEANPTSGKNTGFMVRENLDELVKSLDQLTNEPEIEAGLRMQVGHIYYSLSRFGWARLQFNEAMEIRTLTSGENHRLTLRCLIGVAKCNLMLGRQKKAEAQVQLALEKLDPENHRRTHLSALKVLQQIRDQQHRFDEAFELAEKCLELSRTVHARERKQILDALSICALAAQKVGQLDQAETMARDALGKLSRNHPDKKFFIAEAKFRLAEILVQRDKLREAKQLAIDVIEQQTGILGKDDLHVIQAWILLANIHFREQNLDAAQQVARDSIELTEKLPDWQTQIRLAAKRQLAIILEATDPKLAAETWREIIEARSKRLRKTHDAATDLIQYANLLRDLDQLKESERQFQDAISVLHSLEEVDSLLASTYRDYAAVLKKRGKNTRAAKFEELAEKLSKAK